MPEKTLYLTATKPTTLHSTANTLHIQTANHPSQDIPLEPTERLILQGDITLNAKLLAKLAQHNIGVIILYGNKRTPITFFPRPHHDATIRLRQTQALLNPTVALILARHLIHAKITAQQSITTTTSPTRDKFSAYLTQTDNAASIPSLRQIEGRAAKTYYRLYGSQFADKTLFTGRKRRPPPDPINALISYTAALLTAEASLIAYSRGLDPHLGFLHAVTYNRPSLSCDLIEPLRPHMETWIAQLWKEQRLTAEHFTHSETDGSRLSPQGRQTYISEYASQIPQWRKQLNATITTLQHLIKTHLPQTPYPQTRANPTINT